MSAKSKVVDINKKKKELITFTEEELETLRRTVAGDASSDEFKMFIYLAKNYGLDPFNKEIFFWKKDGKPTIMTSRDGYLKIADRHPQYDGLVSDVVRENDKFRRKETGINHQYGTNRGQIVGSYALVYRKDRSYPVYIFAPFEEYRSDSKIWEQYPSAMILKVAESMALKRAFSVSGLVSREEMAVQQQSDYNFDEIPFSQVQGKKNKGKTQNDKSLKNDQVNFLTERELAIKEIVGSDPKLKEDLYNYLRHVKREKGIDSSKKISINSLSKDQFEQLKSILNTFSRLSAQERKEIS
ncbi:phage recombination protein Bet [Halanaerobium sp. DL-01]|uniref:phage recombination protein Bet n=1 Tax=Halanaerobium sp. DL-01 TaxID=1653064 RepID=UPI000DF4238C|nr:phage recombination protein Bet [Halanaerobium sp. DL-01]RCW88429.1 phage recombination protein Bet [Halanaerobium sp. DL-01]